MFKSRALIAALVCSVMLLAPALAEARAGGGSSMGSRGGYTFQPTPAKPIERSITQPISPPRQAGAPAAGPLTGGTPAGGMLGRSPFMTGILGGFLGAGLFGLMFGNHAWAAEGAGAAGMLGLFLQFTLIAGIAWLALALFRRRMAAAPAGAGATGPLGIGGVAHAEPAPTPNEAKIADQDREAFGKLLVDIQAGWGDGDLKRLGRLATPEMVSYFAEDLTDAASRGVRNVVKDVVLLKGDVVDDWVEGDRHYATAVMTWRAVDYVERDGAVIGGDAKEPSEATEAWTFVRVQGGAWLLSAIQQV